MFYPITAAKTGGKATLLMLFLLLFSTTKSQAQLSGQPTNINMKFYHITVELGLDKPFIKGEVLCKFVSVKDKVQEFSLDLHQDLKVTSTSEGSFEQKGNKLNIRFDKDLGPSESMHELRINYEGVPPTHIDTDGVEKGLRYGVHGPKEEPVIASVCYYNHAHYWFPCRDGLGDKVDSIYVDISIEDRQSTIKHPSTGKPTKLPFIAVSNGKLVGIDKSEEGKKTFKWRHYSRIAPHHVLIAVSNYIKQEAVYSGKNGEEVPLSFYFFSEHTEQAQSMVARTPEILGYLSETFGPYPFAKEGFAITETGMNLGYDGVPTQANILLEEMKGVRMYQAVNLAASMWYGNHISPLSWSDAWIYDALPAYAEAMWQEYRRGLDVRQIILDEKEFFDKGSLYIKKIEDYSKERFLRKGAYVMHMLRFVMGDAYFFETLRSIPALLRKKDYYISGKDFQKIAEYYASENVEQDYSYFFEQWVEGEYYPEYQVEFENGKKGQVTVIVRQTERSTKPKLFKTPADLELVWGAGENARRTERVYLDAAEKTFTFELPAEAIEVHLDPQNSLLKKISYTQQVLKRKKGQNIEDFAIETENGRRKVKLSFKSPKKQDIVISLTRMPEFGDTEKQVLSSIELKKVEGKESKEFEIPLGPKERGVFLLRIEGKYDVFYRLIRIKQLERLFD